MLKWMSFLGGLILTFLSSVCGASAESVSDSYLFEKDGFRIHYVGNGGNCNGCEWIAVDGDIPFDAGRLFRQYVKKHKFAGIPLYVTFNSVGGSLVGGIRLGRAIRSLGMKTSIGKTVIDDTPHHNTVKGKCFSACAYAFLGGVARLVDEGEYGVNQYNSDALLKGSTSKAFSPIDFSNQQTLAGFLLSYLLEMGVSGDLMVEANKTSPADMNILSLKKLTAYRVAFDPKRYEEWNLKAYRNGLVTESRTQDKKNKMTIFCDASGLAKLLLTLNIPGSERKLFKKKFAEIGNFSLLNRKIKRASVRLEERSANVILHVPLSAAALDGLESSKDPFTSFSVHLDEARSLFSLFHGQFNLNGLSSGVRLVRRNCIK